MEGQGIVKPCAAQELEGIGTGGRQPCSTLAVFKKAEPVSLMAIRTWISEYPLFSPALSSCSLAGLPYQYRQVSTEARFAYQHQPATLRHSLPISIAKHRQEHPAR